MNGYTELQNLKKLRERFLLRLYELWDGYVLSTINFKELNAELGISDETGDKIFHYLKDKGLVKQSKGPHNYYNFGNRGG